MANVVPQNQSELQVQKNLDHLNYMAELEKRASTNFEVIQRMLNQLLHNQKQQPSHGSNSPILLQKNQPTTTHLNISKLVHEAREATHSFGKITDPETGIDKVDAKFNIPQVQYSEPKIPTQSPEFTIQKSKSLDLLLHQQSNKMEEEETSRIRCISDDLKSSTEVEDSVTMARPGPRSSGGDSDISLEDDASVKGKGETVALPDLREASLELVVEVTTRETVKAETRGSLAATNAAAMNGARGPRSRSSGDWHRRTLFVAKPAVLVAAAFPWDREREAPTPKNHGRSMENDARRLPIEEKAVIKAGPRVAKGGSSPDEVDGGSIVVLLPRVPASVRKKMEKKLPEREQHTTLLMGRNWAPKTLLGLSPFKLKEAKVIRIFGYVSNFVWDPGGIFLFYALG